MALWMFVALFGAQILALAVLLALLLVLRPLVKALLPVVPMLIGSAGFARVTEDLRRIAMAAAEAREDLEKRKAQVRPWPPRRAK